MRHALLAVLAVLCSCHMARAAVPLTAAEVASVQGFSNDVTFASEVLVGNLTMDENTPTPAYTLSVWKSGARELVCVSDLPSTFSGWIGAAHGVDMVSPTEMSMAWRSSSKWILSARKSKGEVVPTYDASSQSDFAVIDALSTSTRLVFTRPAGGADQIFALLDKMPSIVTDADLSSPNMPTNHLGIALHTVMGHTQLSFSAYELAPAATSSADPTPAANAIDIVPAGKAAHKTTKRASSHRPTSTKSKSSRSTDCSAAHATLSAGRQRRVRGCAAVAAAANPNPAAASTPAPTSSSIDFVESSGARPNVLPSLLALLVGASVALFTIF